MNLRNYNKIFDGKKCSSFVYLRVSWPWVDYFEKKKKLSTVIFYLKNVIKNLRKKLLKNTGYIYNIGYR